MTLKKSLRSPVLWLYLGGALLLIVAAFVWCFKASMDRERVFWGTIENGLSTRGITIEADQESNGAKAHQLIRFSFGGQNLAHTRSILTQGADSIETETLSSPSQDYTRFVSITTDQKKADGSEMDFSNILGVWTQGSLSNANFFRQAVFGGGLPNGGILVPFANLDAEQRSKVVRDIRNNTVYEVDFAKTKKQRVNGRMQYTYSVKVHPVGYILMMKNLAQAIGLHDFDNVNPEDYKGRPAFNLEMKVDARSRQVLSIASLENKTSQKYHNYGIPVQIAPPTDAITSEELQKRLGDLQ